VSSLSIEGALQVMAPAEPGLPHLRGGRTGALRLEPGGLSCRDGLIAALEDDPAADLRLDATGLALVPGLVDAHTHLPFAGWRDGEYAMRIAGASYEEIARAGGGIASSARALAAASDDEVLEQAGALADEMLRLGTTAFECKSGYGLSRAGELRQLGLAGALGRRVRQRTTVTALLAHALPAGFDADGWLDEVEAMLPEVVSTSEARALDLYVESIAFTNEHLARMGELARRFGLALRAHVEQFATHRSVPVALAAGARSVDHLSCLDPADLPALARADCAAVLLPGAELMGEERPAPGRALADAGAICVLATDLNPGTAPIASLPLVIGLAVRRYRWTAAEALAAATLNAAWALGLHEELGSLEPGKRADLVLLDGPIDRVPYRLGHDSVVAVAVAGEIVHLRPGAERRLREA
jgi:imidazolonepropionase